MLIKLQDSKVTGVKNLQRRLKLVTRLEKTLLLESNLKVNLYLLTSFI